jgi:hypothetical protein
MKPALRRVPAAVLLASSTALLGVGCAHSTAAPVESGPAAAGAHPPEPNSPPPAQTDAGQTNPTNLLAARNPRVGLLQLGHLAPQAPAFDSYFSVIGQDGTFIGSGGYPKLGPYMTLPPGRNVWSMRPAGAPANAPMTLTKLVNVQAGQASSVVLFNNGPQGSVVEDALTSPPVGAGLVRVVQGAPGDPIAVAEGQQPPRQIEYGTVGVYRAQPAGPLTVSSPEAGAPLRIQVTPGSTTTVLVTRGPDGVQLDSIDDTVAPRSPPSGASPPASVNTGSGGAAATSTWPPPGTAAHLLAGALLAVAAATAIGLLARRRRA